VAGAGSFTICCSSSKILIVVPPPCRLTPLLFLLFFFVKFDLRERSDKLREPDHPGESVFSYSGSLSSSEVGCENGKRPRASSIKEIPSDHMSDLTVYWAPCIRSGFVTELMSQWSNSEPGQGKGGNSEIIVNNE